MGKRKHSDSSSSMDNLMKEPTITFKNIGGLLEQQSKILDNFINPFINKSKGELSSDPDKGMLFHGKPGTGKTYFAEAIAGELGARLGKKVSFFSVISGQINSSYIADTEKKIIQLFKRCEIHSPSVLFLDEFDSICPSRQSVTGENMQYYNGITNCFLKKLNEVDPSKIIVIAATNRFNALDSAITRAGRMEIHIAFEPPTDEERRNILETLIKEKNLQFSDKTQFLSEVVTKTVSDTPADLKKLVNQIIRNRNKRNAGSIRQEDWILALKQQATSRFSYRYKHIEIDSMLTRHISQKLNEIKSKIDSQLDCMLDSKLKKCPLKKIFIQEGCDILLHALGIGLLNKCKPESLPVFKIDFRKSKDTNIFDPMLEEAELNSKYILALFNIESITNEQFQQLDTIIREVAVAPNTKVLVIATTTENKTDLSKNVREMFQKEENFSAKSLGFYRDLKKANNCDGSEEEVDADDAEEENDNDDIEEEDDNDDTEEEDDHDDTEEEDDKDDTDDEDDKDDSDDEDDTDDMDYDYEDEE